MVILSVEQGSRVYEAEKGNGTWWRRRVEWPEGSVFSRIMRFTGLRSALKRGGWIPWTPCCRKPW